jgi:hypothetical protein
MGLKICMTHLKRIALFFAHWFATPLWAIAATSGLELQPNGTVYDANLRVTWLADANFADTPTGRSILTNQGIVGVGATGLMDYPTAVKYVRALNRYRQEGCPGSGYLCHDDWQLPVTPSQDQSCVVHQGFDGNSFGPGCRFSAFGSLFYVGLGLPYPTTVASAFSNRVGALKNLHPGLYWTRSSAGETGFQTFSFLSGLSGSNTVKYNHLHVIAVHKGLIPGSAPGDVNGARNGVIPYVSGLAAGKAVFDVASGQSWLADANLAATEPFGIEGSEPVPATRNDNAITLPFLAPGGGLLFKAAQRWVNALSAARFAGTSDWLLPEIADLQALYKGLQLEPGNRALMAEGHNGPFSRLQPFSYWACPQSLLTPNRCDYDKVLNVRDALAMRCSFNFDSGFQGTSQESKQYYVLVYHPGR